MRAARIVSASFGGLAALLALGLGLGGIALLVIHATQRDQAGYYHTDTERLATNSYAITTTRLDFGATATPSDWATTAFGTVRVRARAADGGPVFVGIAHSADVDRYLAGSAHDELTDLSDNPFRATYRRHPGEQQPAVPAEQGFWVASASGPGEQTLYWDATGGSWSVVLMNADARTGLAVDASAGVRTGVLLPIGLGLMGVGLLFGALAAVLLVAATRRPGPPPYPGQPPYSGQPAEPFAGPPGAAAPAGMAGTAAAGAPDLAGPLPPRPYPVRVDGRLDAGLNRWLWLVKWFLVIPHLFVLAFLWLAFSVLTVVAGFAILFTGRYPQGIFRFNVGVLRWTWRVAFYATNLATDRYPPFSLDPDPSYPADLDVAYPERLSRSLVLIKWWLLALPHYIIISIFGGGLTWWTWQWDSDGGWHGLAGAGLIGILALVAGVTLAVTARYPDALFSLLMGLQRWTYRVIAYAALMRDEYPPFRLDTGGPDPASPPPPPPVDDRSGAMIGG